MKIHRLWLIIVALLVSLALPPPARAAVSVTYRPGAWSDVVSGPEGVRFVRATAAEVVTERVDWSLVWQTALPEPILYLRACVSQAGEVRAIMQGNQTGRALVVTAAGVSSLGLSFGQNATACGWFPGSGFTFYVQTSPTARPAVAVSAGACKSYCPIPRESSPAAVF